MTRVNVHAAKTNLSHYLSEVEKGEVVVFCRRNEPIAELRAIPKVNRRVPQLGCAKGTVQILPGFFDPLPEEVLRAFEGLED